MVPGFWQFGRSSDGDKMFEDEGYKMNRLTGGR